MMSIGSGKEKLLRMCSRNMVHVDSDDSANGKGCNSGRHCISIWVLFWSGGYVARGCGQRERSCQRYSVTDVFSISYLLLLAQHS
jgi:hypothetical protein